jgi:hypothetical protein
MNPCCQAPQLNFRWKVGSNEVYGLVIAIEWIECLNCGSPWVLDDDNETRSPLLEVSADKSNCLLGVKPVGFVS